MHLGEEDFLGRAVQRTPDLHPPLQGAQLAPGEAARVLPLQDLEEGLGLQARLQGQLRFELGPDVGKGVVAGTPVTGHGNLAGQ